MRIDLDVNATTPLEPVAWEALRQIEYGNPSSAHAGGRKARQQLEDARESVAALLGADPAEVIFTSGATEANNLAILGLAGDAGHILAAPIEHPCVMEPLKQLASRGVSIEWLPVSGEGIVSSEDVRGRIGADSGLITVMLVNHETGAVQPVKQIAGSLAPQVLMHTDAAQAVGKMPVNFHDLGVTSLSASAHKFGGPPGIGLLLLRTGTQLKPMLFGGHQQQGRRPGTEPVALTVGLAAALQYAVNEMSNHRERWTVLRSMLWDALRTSTAPVVLNGPPIDSPNLHPGTLNVSFPGCRGDVLLMALDLAGISCSTGSACSSGSLLPSPVLRAMGLPDDVLRSAIRFSFSPEMPVADMMEAGRRIVEVVSRVRNS